MSSRADLAPRMTTRAALITAGVLGAAVALAWWQVASDARAMCCMLDGLVQAGRAMPFDAGPIHFTGMWTVMMVAMMLPGIVPLALGATDGRGSPIGGIALASGYLAVWIPTAVIAFGALTFLNEVSQPSAALNRIGGAVLVAAGAYQFTGWKGRLVDSFRGQQRVDNGGALGAGLSHGLRCLGASWALMAVLLIVGVMNLAWMAAIGVICLAEKTFARRAALATAVGLALVALGAAIVIEPHTLDVIAQIG
jgi:predicted metal-binding membrane protein